MEKIKTLVEYQQLANRTCPDLGTPKDNILHMQLGLITEIGEVLDIFKKKLAYKKELDLVNLGEELADQMWYVANYGLITKDPALSMLCLEDIEILVQDSYLIPATYTKKTEATIVILTNLLRVLLTSKELPIIDYVVSIAAVCKIWELDFMQILTNNITKLKVRYPEKFTNEAALNRDLDAERKELEKVDEAEDLTIEETLEESNSENTEGRV